MTPLKEVVQVIEVAFSLRKNPRPSNYITEVTHKACMLAPTGVSQAMFTVSPFVTLPPSAKEVVVDSTSNLSGSLGVAGVAILTILLCFALSFFLSRLCLLLQWCCLPSKVLMRIVTRWPLRVSFLRLFIGARMTLPGHPPMLSSLRHPKTRLRWWNRRWQSKRWLHHHWRFPRLPPKLLTPH